MTCRPGNRPSRTAADGRGNAFVSFVCYNAMVEIGFRVSTREALTTPQYKFPDIFELAVRAEEVGFDSVWAGDSLIE